MNNHSPSLVRVSVLFESPAGLRSESETPASRYKRITRDTDEKRKSLLEWLERHQIDYAHVTVMDAFSTIFLDVPTDAIAKLRTVPGVAEVDAEKLIPFEPLQTDE
ncbi:MAG: hypothetical protein SGI73_10975 [Chloroflexota bacterium]|nr:hypothetical protein [Chloroflexota bacterium]